MNAGSVAGVDACRGIMASLGTSCRRATPQRGSRAQSTPGASGGRMRILLAVVLLAGCGVGSSGGPTSSSRVVSVEVRNDYAESILSVSGSIDGGAWAVFFADERFASGEVKTARTTIAAEAGQSVQWLVESMSLGRRHSFSTPSDPVPTWMNPVCVFVYDYDLATGDFVVRHRWER